MQRTGLVLEPDLAHVFTPGLYTRTIFMPAGTWVVSNIHLTEHPFLISQGEVEVYEARNGEMVYLQTLRAPHLGVTKPGTQRALRNLSDVTWSTFHLTEPGDFAAPGETPAETGARIEKRITVSQSARNGLLPGSPAPKLAAPGVPLPDEATLFEECLSQARALVAARREAAPEGCDPQNTSATMIAAYAAVAGVIVAGVGTAISYSAQQSAAEDQAHLALLNAQANTQAIEQKGLLGQEQAQVNEALAANDRRAAEAQAQSLRAQADNASTINEQNIAKSRQDFERLIAAQRVQSAQSGVLDTTGSPYDNLLNTAKREQQKADQINYDSEVTRRQAYAAAQDSENQGIMAEIRGLSQQAAGANAIGGAYQQEAQNQLNLFGQRAQSVAMQNQALGGLMSGISSDLMQGARVYGNLPGGGGSGTVGSMSAAGYGFNSAYYANTSTPEGR